MTLNTIFIVSAKWSFKFHVTIGDNLLNHNILLSTHKWIQIIDLNCLLFIVISAKSTNFTTNTTRYHVESSVDEPHRLQQQVLISWDEMTLEDYRAHNQVLLERLPANIKYLHLAWAGSERSTAYTLGYRVDCRYCVLCGGFLVITRFYRL